MSNGTLNPALSTLPPVLRSYVAGKDGTPVEVHKFADGALQASIDRALAAIPEGENNVSLEVAAGVKERTVTAVLAVKTKNEWTLAVGFASTFDGEWSGQVKVRKTF